MSRDAGHPSLATLVAELEQTYTAEGVLLWLNAQAELVATAEGRAALLAKAESYHAQVAT